MVPSGTSVEVPEVWCPRNRPLGPQLHHRPVRSRKLPAVIVLQHVWHIFLFVFRLRLGIPCQSSGYSNTITWHNFFRANFWCLYAQFRKDDKDGLHVFVCLCTRSSFACGMANPGSQAFEDCGRDHSGALASEMLSRPSVVVSVSTSALSSNFSSCLS